MNLEPGERSGDSRSELPAGEADLAAGRNRDGASRRNSVERTAIGAAEIVRRDRGTIWPTLAAEHLENDDELEVDPERC